MKFGLLASTGAAALTLVALALRLAAPSPYWAKEYGGIVSFACVAGAAAFFQSFQLVEGYALLG